MSGKKRSRARKMTQPICPELITSSQEGFQEASDWPSNGEEPLPVAALPVFPISSKIAYLEVVEETACQARSLRVP
jgi:hypothetical protein